MRLNGDAIQPQGDGYLFPHRAVRRQHTTMPETGACTRDACLDEGEKIVNRVFRFLAAFAVALVATGWASADTVLMKDNVTYDGKVISKDGGLIRMQSGDHEVVLPMDDVANVETNDKTGPVINYEEIERAAKERDNDLVEKTGLEARDRSAVDELLQLLFLGDESTSKGARRSLLDMVKDKNPYRYLEMWLPAILPTRLAPLLEVMFEMNPEGMRETLKQTALSPSETARAASLRLLGKLKDKSALELMKRGMADHNPEVRIAAAQGVQALGAREATPLLLKALTGDDMRVQNASRDALSALWTEPGKEPLNFLQNSGWNDFWKTKAATVPDAWNPDATEPLVEPGTVAITD